MEPEITAARAALRIDCHDAMSLLTDHLDGALAAGDDERLGAHLGGCTACRVVLDQVASTVAIVGSLRRASSGEVPGDRIETLTAAFRGRRR